MEVLTDGGLGMDRLRWAPKQSGDFASRPRGLVRVWLLSLTPAELSLALHAALQGVVSAAGVLIRELFFSRVVCGFCFAFLLGNRLGLPFPTISSVTDNSLYNDLRTSPSYVITRRVIVAKRRLTGKGKNGTLSLGVSRLFCV